MKKILFFILIIISTSCVKKNDSLAPTTGKTIIDPTPYNLSYDSQNLNLTYEIAMLNPIYPTYYGSLITNWTIAPDLPSGLSFSPLSGRITGTPEEIIINPKTYIITGKNDYGTVSTNLSISILSQKPFGLRYITDSVDLVSNTTDLSLFPTSGAGIRGGATITSYAISPALPNGISFNTGNGAIEGKSIGAFPSTTYTITGFNSGGSTTTTISISSKNKIEDVILGAKHSCSKINNQIYCWGDNTYNQIGVNSLTPTLTTIPSANLYKFLAGTDNTCFAYTTSKLYCLGNNKNQQFGPDITSLNFSSFTLIADLIINGSLSKNDYNNNSYSHSCIISNGGVGSCFGNYSFVSNGSPTTYDIQNLNGIIGNIIDIQSGANFDCAKNVIGSIYCWGNNEQGQLGDGTNNSTLIAVTPIGMETGITQVATGLDFACGIKNQSVYCWGNNNKGQLGKASFSGQSSNTPLLVEGLPSSSFPTKIIAGRNFACVSYTNSLYCWGDNTYGQLGVGSSVLQTNIPQLVFSNNISYINSSLDHSCLVSNNDLYCWGKNDKGQLGTGNLINASVPTKLSF